jgi:hypothetical protein
MGIRRIRRMQRQSDMALSRRVNGMRKTKERQRRDARMLEIIKKNPFPFTPPIRSWLSVQLNKPFSEIQEADVQKLLASAR